MGSEDPVHALQQSGTYKLSGPLPNLLRLLKEQPDMSCKFTFFCVQYLRRRQKRGRMAVMAAGMTKSFILRTIFLCL